MKLRASFSKRVAMLRKCLSLAKIFSIKWRGLYKYKFSETEIVSILKEADAGVPVKEHLAEAQYQLSDFL